MMKSTSTTVKEQMQILNKLENERKQFFDVLNKFQFIWRGLLTHVIITNIAASRDQIIYSHVAWYPTERVLKSRRLKEQISQNIFDRGLLDCSGRSAVQMVFASRMNGSLCVCVNYKKLNVIIRDNSNPISKTDNGIEVYRKAGVFINLEANCGY